MNQIFKCNRKINNLSKDLNDGYTGNDALLLDLYVNENTPVC